jgi:hypothetical protein
MNNVLYEKMVIPDSCLLGKRVYKKLFRENAVLSATDKKALSDDVDTIYWQYTFKPSTMPIKRYQDETREYLEVALLQINLKNIRRVKRLAEIIHRAIPYPLILVFVFDSSCLISLAHKRFSQAEKEAIVAEDFQASSWLDLSDLRGVQLAFLESMDLSTWSHLHFYAFYKAAIERVVALNCAEYSGAYSLETQKGLSVDEQISKLKLIEKLQQEKAENKNKLKKEKNLGTQVQLNTKIKQIKDRIETIKGEF